MLEINSSHGSNDQRQRRLRAAGLLASVAAVAALAAGCGSSPSNHTTVGSSPPANFASAAYKFSSCMRAHGVANFPDPKVTSSPGHQSVGIAVPEAAGSSPAFGAAQKACNGILPTPQEADAADRAAQEAHKEGLLSFAHCVRDHGISGFPDPDAQGDLNPQTLSAAGIDVHAPNVLAAARACIPESKGVVTPAAIQQAESSSP